tara:strand:+ start:438 stop:1496 length:1059 start_codon:yes stop_codon:yes gene_type:complete
MAKILIAGAGGAPSEGVIKSLIKAGHDISGMGSEPSDLILSEATRKYYVPYANSLDYKNSLIKILQNEKPDLIHFQNDLEIYSASLIRDEIHANKCKTFMPDHDVIETCVYKFKTWEKFKEAGVIVPMNKMIHNEKQLQLAFKELGNNDGKIWLRSSDIGGGGKGSLATASFDFAKNWIDHHKGWGNFIAAQMLTKKTVTWSSIWYEGKLIVSQGRSRQGWIHGNRSISGVTGVTKIGETYSNKKIDDIGIASVMSVSKKPHGIFGVDMAYDTNDIPNPTEINISRFFTTILFFTEAGLNLPAIFVELALEGKISENSSTKALPNGLLWVRGMDVPPKLISQDYLQKNIKFL